MQKNNPSDGNGDIKENNVNKEIKISISTENPGKFNIVQIRPHATISSYIIVFVKILNDNRVDTFVFEVPKKDIMDIPGLSGAHGTKKQNENQTHIEYRVSVREGNDGWKFLQRYRRKNKLCL